MRKTLGAIALLMFVASCGSSNHSAPRNLENACAIIKERPAYLKAMKSTERKWGVPVAVQMATIYQESKFVGNARTPRQFALGIIPMGRQSSAYGYSQALDGTWDEYRQQQRKRGARRDDIRDATDFMGWYMHETAQTLCIPKTDAKHQYLAYHEGRTGYRRGSYQQKGWLMRVSDEVQDRAFVYQIQLQSCGMV